MKKSVLAAGLFLFATLMVSAQLAITSIQNNQTELVVNDSIHLKKGSQVLIYLPVGKDFIHVALVEHEYGKDGLAIQVRYTCAGDDLLYGLSTKYKSGGSKDNGDDIAEIDRLIASGDLRDEERYVRKRFKHGRAKAKIRAFFVMMRDVWGRTFSFK